MYTDADLQFLAGVIGGADAGARAALIREWRAEPGRIDARLDDERLLRRLMTEDQSVVELSPRLLFTILLRRIGRELAEIPYTVERVSADGRVVVFDAAVAHRLLQSPGIFHYLVELLVSFERTGTVTVRRVTPRPSVRRLSTMSIDDMMELAGLVEPSQRPTVFRRIGDIALFMTGIFPDAVARPPYTRPGAMISDSSRRRWRLEDYESEGRRFYRLAAEHLSNAQPALAGVLGTLSDEFTVARKPLTVLADRYLAWARPRWRALPS